MNEIINKFLLVGDTFMPKMQLRQAGFTYSACGPKSKGSGITTNEFNYQLANELHKPIIKNLKKKKRILLLKIIFGV